MRQYKINIRALAFAAAFAAAGMMTSCTDGFENANKPGDKASSEELNRDNYMTGNFLKNLLNYTFPEQENDYQMDYDLIGNYLGRYFTYANSGFSTKNFVLCNASESWYTYPLRYLKPKIESNFEEIKRITNGEGLTYALALVLRAQGYLTLTDMYGPLIIGADESDANAYSSQKDVYASILNDLDAATAVIAPAVAADASATVASDYDQVYQGKLSAWLKYANSLKLRIAIRMRFVEPEQAKQIGEQAVKDGVMTSNDDNLTISYTPNGLYKTSVEWGDTRACADIESYMNGYHDPRIEKYFSPAATQGDRKIVGMRAAANVGNKTTADALYSAANVGQSDRGIWMTAAEVTFCRAEGALAGWSGMGGTVDELYNEAVTLSFEQWGVTGASEYLNNDTYRQADYVDADGGYGGNATARSTITIKWDDKASDDQKLERLITQKWIAMYPNGQEAWCDLRRTGYPKVFAPAQSSAANLSVANRIPFDPQERIRNKTNYDKAVQLLGGTDDYATKMWWQKK